MTDLERTSESKIEIENIAVYHNYLIFTIRYTPLTL